MQNESEQEELNPLQALCGSVLSRKGLTETLLSKLGTVTAKIQIEETKAQRRSEAWPRSLSMQSLEGGLQQLQLPRSFFHSAKAPSLTRPQCPSIRWKFRLDVC